MVGPGQSYEAMITGEHITARAPPPRDNKGPGPSEMF
jgi:hypothetical protein